MHACQVASVVSDSLQSLTFCRVLWTVACQALSMIFSRQEYWSGRKKNTGVGCHFLLHGILPSQGLNLHLLSLLHRQAYSLPLEPPGKLNIIYSQNLKIKETQSSQNGDPIWKLFLVLRVILLDVQMELITELPEEVKRQMGDVKVTQRVVTLGSHFYS